jgi:hypothetical protein
MEAYPSWTLTEVRNLLESRAIDQGVSGKDNVFGSGLVHLGEPAASVSYSYSRFIPYYSGLANQWTGVALWNPSTTAAVNVRILVYGAPGNLLLEREETIPKKGQISQVLGTGTLREGWIRIEANGPVSGISFVGNSDLPRPCSTFPSPGFPPKSSGFPTWPRTASGTRPSSSATPTTARRRSPSPM